MTDGSAPPAASWWLGEPAPECAAPRSLLVGRHRNVGAALSDERLQVPEVPAGGPVGSISWLRASVSRFCNGAVHDARLRAVRHELEGLEPDELRKRARERSEELLEAGEDLEEISRRVPLEVLAGGLGFVEPEAAARAARAVAAAYFPASPEEAEPAAEAGIGTLLALTEDDDLVRGVARISVLVQACEATAALVTAAVELLGTAVPARASWQVDDVVYEAARVRPPARRSRRVAAVDIAEAGMAAGDLVECDVAAANHDPDVFERPDAFDPGRPKRPHLTFGHGIRPCPASALALALSAGVVEAVCSRDGAGGRGLTRQQDPAV